MRFFKILHFLSLDVVLGSVSMHIMFYHYLLGHWPAWEFDVLLGISVFLIYGIDRQIDNQTSAARDDLHAFHAQHRAPLALLMFGGFLVNVSLLFRVGNFLIYSGFGVIFLLIGYWFAWINRILNRFWGFKEVLTASIFSVGISLSTAYHLGITPHLMAMVLILFLLALLNLWLFTLISEGGRWYFWELLMFVILGLLILLGIWVDDVLIVAILFIIWGIHVWIYYFRAQMRMRYWGDLAFTSPLIYILCHY